MKRSATAQIGLTYDELVKLSPCHERKAEVVKLLGGAKKWDGKKISARQAVKAGVTFDDLVWAASAVARKDKDVERRLRLWMADCAARVLHIYEKDYPTDPRPRNAIIAARQFARREIGAAALAAARAAALAAARDAARDAARAAAMAAARAAAMAAAWAAARDAARAAAWDAARDAAWDAEEKFQFDCLVAWLSDPEATDLALPEIAKKEAA